MFGFHIHKWKIVSSSNWTRYRSMGFACHLSITKILYKCTICGEHKVEEIKGSWATKELME